MLEFKPGLDWSFLLGSQTVLSLGRKRGSEQGGVCQQREAKQCGVVWGRCHFTSETGVTVLGLLGQLRGAPSWTTPGCTVRPDAVFLPYRPPSCTPVCLSTGHRGVAISNQSISPSLSTGGPLPGGPETESRLFLPLQRQCDQEERVLRCITL